MAAKSNGKLQIGQPRGRMNGLLRGALTMLVASSVLTERASAFDFEGYRSGMSLREVLSIAGGAPMQEVAGPAGTIVELSKPYSFELCHDRLIGVSKIIDRATWLVDYRTYNEKLGDSQIQAVAGQSIKTIYFMWIDKDEKVILGLNIDIAAAESTDLGYAINIRSGRPCGAAD